MNNALFLILQRMRAPLLAVIVSYAIAVLGLTLMPGVDDQGAPHRIDFMHAFYVISYTATTIGFGELPYAFSPAQRMWMTLSMYLTVIAWFYALGTIIALVQDAALRRVIEVARFETAVRRQREPFVLICGYGDTGEQLVRGLTAEGCAVVVLDSDADRINALSLEDLDAPVLRLAADVGLPHVLHQAGLGHPKCRALVSVVNNDAINLHVAITGKLLQPGVEVFARADYPETAANMASFGTDHIIQPFELFSDRLLLAMERPCLEAIQHWLVAGVRVSEPERPPLGKWLLCSYGRFGQAMLKRFRSADIEPVILEQRPEEIDDLPDTVQVIHGWGTEAHDLRAAGIEDAVGIVAGTADDTNNLSILMTAREIKPDLFTVARQNLEANRELYDAFAAKMTARASSAMARTIQIQLQHPMLLRYLEWARESEPGLARELMVELVSALGECVPRLIERSLTWSEERDRHLLNEVGDPKEPVIALLAEAGDERWPMPNAQTLTLLMKRNYTDLRVLVAMDPFV